MYAAAQRPDLVHIYKAVMDPSYNRTYIYHFSKSGVRSSMTKKSCFQAVEKEIEKGLHFLLPQSGFPFPQLSKAEQVVAWVVSPFAC
jgi:hypothetical protein